MTVGQKIKIARKLRGITQKELASMINLPDVRIRQYETDQRTPKESQLQIISDALGMPIEFFRNHIIDSYTDIMHVLFELEDELGITIERTPEMISGTPKYSISFNNSQINNGIEKWLEKKELFENELDISSEEYSLWKACYPQSVVEEFKQKIQEEQKKQKEI